jgi:hypothetical protein
MDAIDTQTTKVTQMREYIKKCRAELSATEVAELANRLRQYWSASSNKQNYLEKISELEKETQKVLKARKKANNIFFVVGILVALAIHYLNLVDDGNKIIFGFGVFAFIVIKEFSYQLEANNNSTRQEIWNQQVIFFTHEMSCSGGAYVNYENEYLIAKSSDDNESKKTLHELYRLSVEIAILHGLKTTLQSVDF